MLSQEFGLGAQVRWWGGKLRTPSQFSNPLWLTYDCKALDYKSKDCIYDYLTSLTADTTRDPFDAIIDCVGDDTLFHRSPGYLKATGKLFSIEGGPLGGLTLKRLPVILGGTPRPFVNVFSKPSTASINMVVGWIEKGWIKELPVDSTFQMDDAIQVYNAEAEFSVYC